jgi:glycosyltransferase involved in cell wall biosynthesis
LIKKTDFLLNTTDCANLATMSLKLSILIPCYNEKEFVTKTIQRILDVKLNYPIEKEIIVVDDGSTDKTFESIQDFITLSQQPVTVIRNQKNSGKGYSIKNALEKATGDIVIIQDADLEYDPSDYNKMLHPIIDGHADVVFGSRFVGDGPHRVLFFFHTIGNKFLTFLSNLFTGLNLTDMETGYKMFRSEILKQIHIKENRFGFEPEITAKVSRIKNIRIYEVGIAYYGRTYNEGKKIKWPDGFKAIWYILKYNIFSRR